MKKARETAILYAEARLQPWGKWTRDDHNALGFPRVSIVHKVSKRKLVQGTSRNKTQVTAKGKETLSFRPKTTAELPEALAMVDKAVARLPENLRGLIMIEYVTHQSAHIRDKLLAAAMAKSRYYQLLECAKYSVFVALSIDP